jgi:hypothetical protein
MTVPPWEYVRWVIYIGGAMGVWRYLPLTVIRLVAAFTKDERRHKQCMEVLRLARRDASHIPSYVVDTSDHPASVEVAGQLRRGTETIGRLGGGTNAILDPPPPTAKTATNPVASRPGPQVAQRSRTRKRPKSAAARTGGVDPSAKMSQR